jgi:hypothetical protein
MAITKSTSNEVIEVVGEYKLIGVKKITTINEDGEVISKSNHRSTYSPDTDVSTLDADVAAVASAVWTQEVKDAYQAYVATLPQPDPIED